MRKGLKKIEDARLTFKGIFKRYGLKNNWNGFPEKTILLVDVKDSHGVIVTDHIWFSLTKGFQSLGELKEGDLIQFDARVKRYLKGYVNHREYIDVRELDYKLNNPTKIKMIHPVIEYKNTIEGKA
jgi:hypothetical protein